MNIDEIVSERRYEHLKTGRHYLVVGTVSFQCSTQRDLDGQELVVYVDESTGAFHGRLAVEFAARFRPV